MKVLKFIINFFAQLFPVDDRIMIFETGLNKADDNPRALFDYMLTNVDQFKYYFVIEKDTNNHGIPHSRILYRRTLKYLYIKSITKTIVYSQSLGSPINKRVDQICIQLWHGPFFKVEGHDRFKSIKRAPLPHVLDWDVFISLNFMDSAKIKSNTGYKGEVLDLGLARFDYLYNLFNFYESDKNFKNDDVIKMKKKILGYYNKEELNGFDKFVLYAPTFRDWELDTSLESRESIVELNKIIEMFKYKLNDMILMVKMHPLYPKSVLEELKRTNINNVIVVDDTFQNEELFIAADALITDYSSVFYDYSILRKPIIWFLYDEEIYEEKRGGVYYERNLLPGKTAKTLKELDKLLNFVNNDQLSVFNVDHDRYFKTFHYNTDGKACKRISDYIIKRLEYDNEKNS